MNWVDLLLLVVFAVAVFSGLRRGLIGQLGSLAAVVAALVSCRIFGDVLTGWFQGLVPEKLDTTPMATFIPAVASNALVYTAVYYLVKLVAGAARHTVRLMLMGPLDRVLGVIFALFKWGLGASLVLNIWLALYPSSTAVRDSTLGGGVAVESVMELAPWLWGTAGRQLLDHDDDSSGSASVAQTSLSPQLFR